MFVADESYAPGVSWNAPENSLSEPVLTTGTMALAQ